ncbi:ERF family protein [bacterium]|nr:ERF family protein [bacterium]
MKSESIAKLSMALSKAQGTMNVAKKDANNPFFKSKYADLESVWEACREALTQNELAVIQTPEIFDGQICLITTLTHSSGEWIESKLPLMLTKQDPQTMGSALTYARRYALAAMVGVVQSDDDGEKAMDGVDRSPQSKHTQRAFSPPSSTFINAKQKKSWNFTMIIFQS